MKSVVACGAAVALVPRSDPHYGLGAVTPVLATNRHGHSRGHQFRQRVRVRPRPLQRDADVDDGPTSGSLRRCAGRGDRCAYALRRPPALRAATVGGARAAGLQDEIGTLVAGAKADLTVLSLERLRPVASHLGAAVAYASVADVDKVVVDGTVRKSGGELVGVDRAALVRDA